MTETPQHSELRNYNLSSSSRQRQLFSTPLKGTSQNRPFCFTIRKNKDGVPNKMSVFFFFSLTATIAATDALALPSVSHTDGHRPTCDSRIHVMADQRTVHLDSRGSVVAFPITRSFSESLNELQSVNYTPTSNLCGRFCG